jgi:spore germination protein
LTRKTMAALAAGILLVGLLAVWGVWTARLQQENRALALQLEVERQRNFSELTARVQNIGGMLAKGLAAGSVSQNMFYLSESYRHATAAVSHLMALPLPGPLSASAGRFLNQVGDFAWSVVRAEAAGRPMTREQRGELRRLQAEAALLAEQLQAAGNGAGDGQFRWAGQPATLAGLLRGGLRKPQTQDQAPVSLLPGGLAQVGPQMDRLPVLTYDGPFSDHLEHRSPALGGTLLSEEEARQRAFSYIPGGERYTVVDSQRMDGQVPAWSFRLAPTAAASGARPVDYTLVVEVTQEGGHLLSLLNARLAGNLTMGLERAQEVGLSFLSAHGFAEMIPTWGTVRDGFATVQYAGRHRGVTVYPDQVRLRIALDNGEVVGVDARLYVMNYRDRGSLEQPAVTRRQAAGALNPLLQVERVTLALIPTEAGDGEVLCYEFLGSVDGETFLVYVNAKTGHEERILQLLFTDEGTLAL